MLPDVCTCMNRDCNAIGKLNCMLMALLQHQQLHTYAPLLAARRAFRYNCHGYCATDETANKQRVAVANHAHDKVPQRWWA
jgi:hypothetical protein